MGDLLVRGGTVVDGTGAPGYRADVRIREGRIVEIGPELPRAGGGEQVIDADGAVVAPGFIEAHTHVDGHMWWNPDLDPLPAYGVTTVVMGNCGMSVAPLSAEARGPVLDLFCFLEDLPLSAFHQDVPWNWERWPEYRTAVQGQATSVNVAGFVGHLTLRTTVMGGDAAWSREATAAEIARMAELLDEALGHGAIGLSTNLFDKDRYLRSSPPRLAADEEFAELVAVLVPAHRRDPPDDHPVQRPRERRRRRGAACRDLPSARGTRPVDLHPVDPKPIRPARPQPRAPPAAACHGRGHVAERAACAARTVLQLRARPYLPACAAWNEWMNSPMETKLATLADPEWRDRARNDWDKRERAATSRLDRPESLILELSETGQGPLGISLQDYADREGLHISDALATWLIANGLRSCLRGTPEAFDEPAVAELFKDPHVLTNINDSGAHLQLFCGAGHNLYLLTHYVRDAGLLTLEEGVHNLTGKLAGYFGMGDRGTIAVGQAGDLVVFALDEIEVRPVRKSYDNPDGSWRFTRDPSGIRATVVSGVPTVLDTAPTATRPGTMVGRAAR
ncbi:N-acyl-D-amino-acid deacylase family protein [Yinghuangia aomiensis]